MHTNYEFKLILDLNKIVYQYHAWPKLIDSKREWPAMYGSWTENVVLWRNFRIHLRQIKRFYYVNYWVSAQNQRSKSFIWVVTYIKNVKKITVNLLDV